MTHQLPRRPADGRRSARRLAHRLLAAGRPPERRPAVGRLVAALLLGTALLASAACDLTGATSPHAATERPTPSPSPSSPAPPTASPTMAPGALPDVPVRSASLDDATVPASAAPVALGIPALDVTVPVDPVGVAPDGQMEIPPRAERAGWYRFGPTPGDAGTAVVAAHVDSVASAGLGPFARLEDAAVGDVVDVTLADGSARRFVVTDVRRTAKAEIAWADVFVRGGPPRLALITCGGVFQRDVGRYADNVIVTAEPAGGS